MELTQQQKAAIVKYITGWSTKAVLEDVDEVGCVWTEETSDELRDAVSNFLDECSDVLRKHYGAET
jgi:hypothetical protein